jgi:gliding motility-associated-like protein
LSAQSNHPNTNFLWSNYMVASEIAVNPSTSTMYSVTGTDAYGCTGIAYSIVNVLAVPQITATPPNLTVCSETQVTVSAQSNMTGTSFHWDNGATIDMFVVTPLITTTYSVTGTAPNGCSGTAQAQINVQSAPQITILPDNPHICIGESLTLIALGANQFDWMPAVQYDLPNGSQVTVTPDFTTHYLVQGTDAYGCTGEALATVTVHQPPQVDFTTDMTTKCAGTPVQYFSVCHPENEIDSYLWNFGNPSSGQGNTSGVANPGHTYNLPGTYWVSLEVTSIYGCTVTVAKPDFVCVYPNPVAAFTRTPDITDLSSPLVSVFNQAIGITDLLYDFGDPEAGTDNFSTFENAVHEYTKPGEYRIWQFVTNEWGCVDSASNRVIIQPSWEIYIPNAFTPNADGINDYFFPSGFGVEIDYFEMYIYTRWGEEIFNTKNVNEGWNGSVKNGSAIAKPDVYVYVIKIRDAFGHDRQFVGNITVLR